VDETGSGLEPVVNMVMNPRFPQQVGDQLSDYQLLKEYSSPLI